MSSSELAEAGVLGLEDHGHPVESENLIGLAGEDEGPCTLTAIAEDTEAFYSRPDLLTELRKVNVLDELIVEENLKIHELRRCEENPKDELSGSRHTNEPSSTSEERKAFRLQLEKEKREVERMEKSLDKECKEKKHDKPGGGGKRSTMETAIAGNKEDRALCDELVKGVSIRSQKTHSTAWSQQDLHTQGKCKTQSVEAELSLQVAKEETPKDLDQLPDSQCQELSRSESEPSACNRRALNRSTEGCKYNQESAEAATVCKPEGSLLADTRSNDGAFHLEGISHIPPQPSEALLPVNNNLTEHEAMNSTPPSAAQDPASEKSDLRVNSVDALPENVKCDPVLNPHLKEHCTNNNNNHVLLEKSKLSLDYSQTCGTITKDEEDVCVQTEVQVREGVRTSPPTNTHSPLMLPPDLPLEFDPGGEDDREDLSDVMRVSGSGSAGIQAQLHLTMTEVTDYKTPIVLDTGSGLMKAGFADQDLPNIVFPTIIGQPKYEEIMNGNLERETYIGHQAQHMRGVLLLKHPIKNGVIRNWDEMEKIWHHTFQQLCVEPEDHPVLLTEAAMNPLENRQRMVEIMFECFNVPFTYVAMQAVLALYAAGRCSGVVFDSGNGVSHSVPVFEGYSLPHAVQCFPLAGADVTVHLQTLLQEQGVCMRTTAEVEIVREMKEMCCYVAADYEAELTQGGSPCREMHYTMPDGQIVTLSTERFRAPEILFKPELIGRDHDGMHKSVLKSVLSSDMDLRRCFLGNIVLSGGNTLLAGLPERLQAEIRGLVPGDTRDSVRVTSPKDRDFSVWSGGAVLANLPAFSSAWISQEEYEEFGPQIVFRKCF